MVVLPLTSTIPIILLVTTCFFETFKSVAISSQETSLTSYTLPPPLPQFLFLQPLTIAGNIEVKIVTISWTVHLLQTYLLNYL